MFKKVILFLFTIIILLGCSNRDGEIIEMIKAMQTQNEELKVQINTLQNTAIAAMATLNKISLAQATTDKKVDALQTDLKSILLQLSSIATQITAENANTADIKAKLDALQVKCIDLVNEIQKLNSLISGNNSSITSLTVNHNVLNGVAPLNKTINYGVYTSYASGFPKMWITQNLGAERAGFAVDEKNILSSGWYFQFNRKQGFQNDLYTRLPNSQWISVIQEDNNWLITNDPCRIELGGKWRLPTMTEWSEERNSWNGEAFLSPLKIISSAYLSSSSGDLSQWGISGNYWSSTQKSASIGWYLGGGGPSYYDRTDVKALAFPCRCVSEF